MLIVYSLKQMPDIRRILQNLLLQVFVYHEFIDPADLLLTSLQSTIIHCRPQFLSELMQEIILVCLSLILPTIME